MVGGETSWWRDHRTPKQHLNGLAPLTNSEATSWGHCTYSRIPISRASRGNESCVKQMQGAFGSSYRGVGEGRGVSHQGFQKSCVQCKLTGGKITVKTLKAKRL